MRAIVAIITIGLSAVALSVAAQEIPSRLPPLSVAQQQGWQILAKSGQGRPIEYAQFGLGPDKRRLMVIGPLAGDQPAGIALIDKLADACRDPNALSQMSVTVVRDPNPDGRARFTAENAAGVQLDRNFPTADWQREILADKALSGGRPGSEVETQALLRAITACRPELVIVVRCSGQPSLSGRGVDERILQALGQGASLELADVSIAGGSLVAYTSAEQSIPTIVLDVPDLPANALWRKIGPSLLSSLGVQVSPPPRELLVDSPTSTNSKTVTSDVAGNAVEPNAPRESLQARPVASSPRPDRAEVTPKRQPEPRPLTKVELPNSVAPMSGGTPLPADSRSVPPRSIPWPASRIERTSPEGY